MPRSPRVFALRLGAAVALVALVRCSSATSPAGDDAGPSATGPDGGTSFHDAGADAELCYSDNDGINGGAYTFDLTVDDTGFSKLLLSTENDAQVTLTLKNLGTKPHGFEVGCTTAEAPAGCPTKVCFPANATIAPLAPGESKTIVFGTPTPDNLIYPFKSSEPADGDVPGLNDGQWSLL